jgi:hypothetical protein
MQDRVPEVDVVRWMGVRLRRARLRQRHTQDEVASAAGVSQSMISRMELGRGGGMQLTAWVAVGRACGVDLFRVVDEGEPFGLGLILACADAGGWTSASRDGSVLILDRPPRRVRCSSRPLLRHGERLVVSLVDVVTDMDLVIEGSRRAAATARRDLPEGWSCGALVVVRWTTANRRRLTESRARLDLAYPDSGSSWIGAVSDPESRMPGRPGLLWIDARGTRLIPTGLHLRRA